MLRNKEIKTFLVVMGSISMAMAAAAYFFPVPAAVMILITSLFLTGCSLLFSRRRYREIEMLSRYLRRISSSDYTFDVRDNQEGELSILKNDIYKVTSMLAEQSLLLQEEKNKLAVAMADISHQLKTPLTSMMLMAELLSDEKMTETKRKQFTRSIRVQLERIEWLVSSLLKLSKIDAGTVHFKKDRVAVKDLVQKALQPVLIPMDIKEQTVAIKGEDTASFTGDLNWTAEALTNILKNCVEHAPQGGTLSIAFSENPLFTEIVVADNGKGIPKEDIPYIFNRFYKGKGASEESVGIGLAIANSIITSQNGDIAVSSEKGKGTRFHIKFYKQII
jgi:signal transduction histidine kinase